MKKTIITSIIALTTSTVFASDYIPQEVTSEVWSEQVQITEESYKKECDHKYMQDTYEYELEPVTIHTGKTVTVQNHYDVYQPKVVYEKVNSYTTTKVCEYCK